MPVEVCVNVMIFAKRSFQIRELLRRRVPLVMEVRKDRLESIEGDSRDALLDIALNPGDGYINQVPIHCDYQPLFHPMWNLEQLFASYKKCYNLYSACMTLNQAFDPFMLYCESERMNAVQTRIKYRDCFRSWLLPFFGERDIDTLTRIDVLSFREQFVHAKLSISRQYSLLTTLKVFLKFCRTVLKVKCLDPAEIVLPNRGRPHVEVLGNEELKKLFDAIDIHTFSGARLRAFIELILGSGVRNSEALSLDREIIDHEKSEVEIVGKGNKKRTIFLTDRSKVWLRRYLSFRCDDHPALFVTTGSRPNRWAREDISRFFIRLKQKSGLRGKVTPHIFRHTYCTNLLKNGADITFIRDLAGHENIQTTAKYYLGVDKKTLRNIVDKYVHYDTFD
jgi:site-specific recombinase XerD